MTETYSLAGQPAWDPPWWPFQLCWGGCSQSSAALKNSIKSSAVTQSGISLQLPDSEVLRDFLFGRGGTLGTGLPWWGRVLVYPVVSIVWVGSWQQVRHEAVLCLVVSVTTLKTSSRWSVLMTKIFRDKLNCCYQKLVFLSIRGSLFHYTP